MPTFFVSANGGGATIAGDKCSPENREARCLGACATTSSNFTHVVVTSLCSQEHYTVRTIHADERIHKQKQNQTILIPVACWLLYFDSLIHSLAEFL
jgi:hypothetical protein